MFSTALIRLVAFVTRRRCVYLRDRDGEVTFTMARKTPFGWVAARYWPVWDMHTVILGDDGKVVHSYYVDEWRDAR